MAPLPSQTPAQKSSPLLSPEIVKSFEENGFVVTPSLLAKEELERFSTAVDAAVARRTRGDARTLAEKSLYEQSFVQCMRLWETEPEVRPFTFHRGLAQAAAELLGQDAVRIWQDQALYKEPGGRVTTPHQDATFWPIGATPLVSAWIPFEDSTVESGATAYVPGSHKAGRLRVVDITHSTEPYDILRDPKLLGREPVFVEAPRGSVVWHHGLTVHQAAANESSRMRRVFTIIYFADGWRRTKPGTFFPLDREGIGPGELMQGPGLPIAWPREPGDLPEPPTVIGEGTGPQMVVPPARR